MCVCVCVFPAFLRRATFHVGFSSPPRGPRFRYSPCLLSVIINLAVFYRYLACFIVIFCYSRHFFLVKTFKVFIKRFTVFLVLLLFRKSSLFFYILKENRRTRPPLFFFNKNCKCKKQLKESHCDVRLWPTCFLVAEFAIQFWRHIKSVRIKSQALTFVWKNFGAFPKFQ